MSTATLAAGLLAAAGCTDEAADNARVHPNTQPSVTTSVSVINAGDPRVTRHVCTDSAAAAADATRTFNDQFAAMEMAAARGDEAGLVAAAEAINKKITEVAAALSAMARESVTPAVKKVLIDAVTILGEIASEDYTGTPADIRAELKGLSAAFRAACTRA